MVMCGAGFGFGRVTHERISGRKLWRMAISSSLRMLTVSGTRLTRLTIESVTICVGTCR